MFIGLTWKMQCNLWLVKILYIFKQKVTIIALQNQWYEVQNKILLL